jgi:RNA polymerase sigma-70 factor (family 1)
MPHQSDLTDEELVILIAREDAIAFKLLYNRYWKKMLAKAYFQLQSHIEAEEVVQDAFMNLWKRRQTLQIKYTFHTYIASVVRYEVMARVAQRKKWPLYIEDLPVSQIEDNSTEHWLAFEELSGQIEQLVNSLPEKCQLIFRMSRESGFSHKQISEYLTISHKTVESHLNKALKILRLSLHNFICIGLLAALITGLASR